MFYKQRKVLAVMMALALTMSLGTGGTVLALENDIAFDEDYDREIIPEPDPEDGPLAWGNEGNPDDQEKGPEELYEEEVIAPEAEGPEVLDILAMEAAAMGLIEYVSTFAELESALGDSTNLLIY